MKKLHLIILLVILLCFPFACQQSEEVAAGKEVEPAITVDNVISADGVSIAYEVRGEGKPAVVFIHGWSNKRSIWDVQMAHFSPKYKVVAIDLAGFGDSGNNREEWTMEAYGKDVAAVLDKLKLREAVLIGLSMGAPVVIETAELSPENITGIVLVDFLQDIETKYTEEFIEDNNKTLMDFATDLSLEKIKPFFINNKDELADRYVSMVKDVPKIGWSESIKNVWLWCNDECTKSLQQIKAPVTSINADQIPTNIEAFKTYVPSFKVKIIPGVGHFVPWEAPDEFNRLLEEAIQEFLQMAKQ